MLTLLFSIFIQPLLDIYGFVFSLISTSYDTGFRIILFALIVNLLLVPVYAQMEKQNRRLRQKQAAMSKEVQRLKRHFKGRERYFYLRTLYRQHNFKHWKVLFSSADLFIQVLIFATVYKFISSLGVINGASFGPIQDLSEPDRLLGGLNLLPMLMTLVNAVSLALYVRQRSRLYQGIGLAVLFLIILYPSASALVLYWTTNNLFSLARNAFARANVSNGNAYEGGRPVSERAPYTSPAKVGGAVAGNSAFPLYVAACFTAAFLIFIWVPITIFLTSPGEIGLHVGYLVETNAKNAMIWVYLAALFYAFASFLKVSQHGYWLAKVSVFLLVILLAYAYILPFGYPMLTGLAFELPPMSRWQLILRTIADIVVFATLLYLIGKAFRRFSLRAVLLAVVLLNISLVSVATVGLLQDQVGGFGNVGGGDNKENALLHYSQDKPNVLIIFLDRLMGGFIESSLQHEPELVERMAGFTWYPKSISSGQNSIAGVHPLFGGYDYTPHEMNARKESLRDLSVEAYSILPYNFSNNGYQVNFIEPNGLAFTMRGDCDYLQMPRVNCGHIPQAVVKERAAEHEFSLPELSRADYSDLLTLVSLMRAAPYAVKAALHRFGPWEPFMDHSAGTTFSVWAKLKALPSLSGTESDASNLNIFTNILPHEPYYLHEDCIPSKERYVVSDEEVERRGHLSLFSLQHENAARCSLLLVSDYLDYLKQSGVYDNTEIVIVSDHGIVGPVKDYSSRAIQGGTSDNLYVRSRSALLVKPIGAEGPLRTSERFVTNADVPSLVCERIGGCVNPYLSDRSVHHHGRNDPFVVSFVPWQFSAQRPSEFVIEAQYQVLNKDPYDAENWVQIE